MARSLTVIAAALTSLALTACVSSATPGANGSPQAAQSSAPSTSASSSAPSTAPPPTASRPPPAQVSKPPPPRPAPPDAAAVVQAYYDAINAGDYAQAWQLGGDNLGSSYSSFVAGFSDTVLDTLDITKEAGQTVFVTITALNADSSQQTYAGDYTVAGTAISAAHISLTGNPGGGQNVFRSVHPGAFCTPVGAFGYTDDGTLMSCTSSPPGTEARWRRK
jgi:eukaryotic-like serine/threonine-protein kinase